MIDINKNYIAFYKGTKENPKAKFVDNLICLIDGSQYSHVELVLSDKDTKDIKPKTIPKNKRYCLTSSMRDNGVRLKPIDLTTGSWDVYELVKPFRTDVNWYINHQHMEYDYMG